ncbi:hypothetical protein SEA_SAMISTI12_120 [Streptomyces phage Samisti12]|uniref:Uncharacterized protein n=4 Tax=Samistivirus TaxID=2560220 RepID=A0A223G012_9CAUD|nr:hypothetical protein FDI39_gp153 [Streptomyces phage Samisti12]ASR76540.1 hypothetical protein SEA_SUSHI23_118 [Streptomyces phage Sushi23]AST15341.1 hypothetical protein SEA_SAMISTI12_120 [Streptomyces phage Samisti12]WDS51906.1 hypothetical protein SEA_PEPPERWOOD_119 [Streptomyces phage Pepperwood]WNN95470.1 hypothetical protein SEA_WATERMOORE_118 [Streptomyces phage Watermoore]
MAIRFCPSCMQNVVTIVQKSNCKHCGTVTKPVDEKLPLPDEGEVNDLTGKHRKE